VPSSRAAFRSQRSQLQRQASLAAGRVFLEIIMMLNFGLSAFFHFKKLAIFRTQPFQWGPEGIPGGAKLLLRHRCTMSLICSTLAFCPTPTLNLRVFTATIMRPGQAPLSRSRIRRDWVNWASGRRIITAIWVFRNYVTSACTFFFKSSRATWGTFIFLAKTKLFQRMPVLSL
jgi:hypothetical protein